MFFVRRQLRILTEIHVSNPYYEVNCNVHSSVFPLQFILINQRSGYIIFIIRANVQNFVTTSYCPWCSHHLPHPGYELTRNLNFDWFNIWHLYDPQNRKIPSIVFTKLRHISCAVSYYVSDYLLMTFSNYILPLLYQSSCLQKLHCLLHISRYHSFSLWSSYILLLCYTICFISAWF